MERRDLLLRNAGALTLATSIVCNGANASVAYRPQTQHLISESGCAECRLILTDSVTIGDLDGPAALVPTGYVQRLPDGRLVIGQKDHLKVFSGEGTFIQTIGREGRGPGEYSGIVGLHYDGSHCWVFDSRQARITQLTEEFEVTRMTPWPFLFPNVAPLPDDRILVNANVPTEERIGFPLHIIDHSGEIIRSFGVETPVARPDLPIYLRRFAVGREGTVWVSDRNQYVIEQWDTTGTLRGSVGRRLDWFPARVPGPVMEPSGRIQPHIQQMRFVGRDTLAVMVIVADPEWRKTIRYGDHPHGPDKPMIRLSNEYSDTYIDLIDLDDERLIVSTRFDQRITHFADGNHVYGYWEDENGVPKVTVWRIELAEP